MSTLTMSAPPRTSALIATSMLTAPAEWLIALLMMLEKTTLSSSDAITRQSQSPRCRMFTSLLGTELWSSITCPSILLTFTGPVFSLPDSTSCRSQMLATSSVLFLSSASGLVMRRRSLSLSWNLSSASCRYPMAAVL